MLKVATIKATEDDAVERSVLTQARLRELFDYVPETGALVWKISTSRRVKIGDEAGVIAVNGRRYVGVDGERHLAHRLVWFWHKGEWPTGNVAPENGDYLDTRIGNLREETFAETARRGGTSRSTQSGTGIRGVYYDADRKKYVADIYRDYKAKFLGRFDTLEEAAAAVEKARTEDETWVDRDEREVLAKKAGTAASQRRLWKNTQKNAGGVTGWTSFEEFIADIGVPLRGQKLAAIDPALRIGPQNFSWAPMRGQFDHKTREGRIAYMKAHRAAYPDLYRDKSLRRDFPGLDGLVGYDQKFAEQKGVCAICSQPETTIRANKILPLTVDHDHANCAERGLLCRACNMAVGQLRDNPELMRKAAEYVEHWRVVHNQPLPDNVIPLKGA